jgi:hypothetical protein
MKTTLEIISDDIVFYLSPEFLKEELKQKIANTDFDKKLTKKYQLKFLAINQALVNISKYDTYFSKLYIEDDNVSKYDILKYHTQNYVQSISNLENKLIVLIGSIKNDLLKVYANKEEIKSLAKHLISEVQKSFVNSTKHRNTHVHDGLEFTDDKVLNAKASNLLLQNKHLLTHEAIEVIKDRLANDFNKSQEEWLTIFRNNTSQINGIVETVMSRNEKFIYLLTKIETLRNKLSPRLDK